MTNSLEDLTKMHLQFVDRCEGLFKRADALIAANPNISFAAAHELLAGVDALAFELQQADIVFSLKHLRYLMDRIVAVCYYVVMNHAQQTEEVDLLAECVCEVMFERYPDDLSHYVWLNQNAPAFFAALGLPADKYMGLISAHGDKCYSYNDQWIDAGIPFEHGVAIYLLTYIAPWSKTARPDPSENKYINPGQWVISHYPVFKHLLPSARLLWQQDNVVQRYYMSYRKLYDQWPSPDWIGQTLQQSVSFDELRQPVVVSVE